MGERTSAPWHVGKDFRIVGADSSRIARCDNNDQVSGRLNSLLIAAAPDLLETLEGMSKAFERMIEKYCPDGNQAEWLIYSHEAIKKAKGETP